MAVEKGARIHGEIETSERTGEKSQFLSGEMIGRINQLFVGKWADPDGTAMSGQPLTEPEQAPELHPLTKISKQKSRASSRFLQFFIVVFVCSM